jgi:hypothetical protein
MKTLKPVILVISAVLSLYNDNITTIAGVDGGLFSTSRF